jgi:hypothetical protein
VDSSMFLPGGLSQVLIVDSGDREADGQALDIPANRKGTKI